MVKNLLYIVSGLLFTSLSCSFYFGNLPDSFNNIGMRFDPYEVIRKQYIKNGASSTKLLDMTGEQLQATLNYSGATSYYTQKILTALDAKPEKSSIFSMIEDGVRSAIYGLIQSCTNKDGSINMDELKRKLHTFGIESFKYSVLSTAIFLGSIKLVNFGFKYLDFMMFTSKPVVFTKHFKARSYFSQFKEKLFGRERFQMVFDASVQKKLDEIVTMTNAIYTKKIMAPYENLLIYGKPGTGKTMFARYLAYMTGMEYAEATGGAFLQEGTEIKAINDMFDYANKTSGLLVFIDEADSLFVDRNQLSAGSNARKYEVLNHLLNRLGEPNNKLMLVCATNHPVVFDEAMSRRFAQAIEMPLPGMEARQKLFAMYINKAASGLKAMKAAFELKLKPMRDTNYIEFARLTDQMSGSDIATIVRQMVNKYTLATINAQTIDILSIAKQVIADYRKKMNVLAKP